MTRTPVLHIGSIHCLLYISSINWEEDIKVAWPQTQLGLLLRHKLNIVQDSVERRFLLRTTKESQLLYNLVNWLTQTSCLLFHFHSCTRWQAKIWRTLYPLDCTKNLVMEFFTINYVPITCAFGIKGHSSMQFLDSLLSVEITLNKKLNTIKCKGSNSHKETNDFSQMHSNRPECCM